MISPGALPGRFLHTACSACFFMGLLLFFVSRLGAQNLVPNPGFEYTGIPQRSRYPGNIEQAPPWFPAGTGSPDLIRAGERLMGRQTAAEGGNYAGLILYDADNAGFREYLEVRLAEPLVAGQEYCFSFSLSAADNSYFFTNELGIHFGSDSLRAGNWSPLSIEPQLKTGLYEVLADTAGWKKFSFSYRAWGGEQFLTIGNFRNDDGTWLQVNDRKAFLRLAYIYVDDFFLQACSMQAAAAPASGFSRSPEGKGKLFVPNVITPNGDGFNDEFFIPELPGYTGLVIMDRYDKVVFRTANYRNNWNGDGLPAGKYNYELNLPDGNIIFGTVELVRKKTGKK